MAAALEADSSTRALFAPRIQSGLLNGFGGTFIGSGISAMPSLHVAMAYLLYLAVSARLKLIALVYVGLIWIGSVHLGWHYAVDGLLSILVVFLIWRGAGSFVEWLERPWSGRAVGLTTVSVADGPTPPLTSQP